MKNVPMFPPIEPHRINDANPAIQLYGRRFLKEQTEIEYLVEFLLLFVSEKEIGKQKINGAEHGDTWQGFPRDEILRNWPDKEPLIYTPRNRLILKLFAFLGSSDLQTRHKCHRDKFEEILAHLKSKIQTSGTDSKDEILSTMEKVLVGFIGIGGSRTWCTHSFLPAGPGLIAGETIWEKSKGKRNQDITWEQAWNEKMFTFTNHDFLARGGEVLYLQLCNLFRRADTLDIQDFEKNMGHKTGTAGKFHIRIEAGLKNMLTSSPAPVLNTLSQWVEKSADSETIEKSEGRKATCGWCPEETWPEAYLFACELANISEALLDPIEKIEMLKLCCVFQVMRNLCAQAARYWNQGLTDEIRACGGINGFAWVITDAELKDRPLKEAAKRNLIRIQEMIHGALRTRNPQDLTKKGRKISSYEGGDEQGQELFVKLGKKIEFIAPYQGPGVRFVMTDTLLRYLVLALVSPGTRITLASFQESLYRHYGAAFGEEYLNRAIQWTYPDRKITPQSLNLNWIEEKLKATGFLIPLSDAVSLIYNPFITEQEVENRA